MFWSSFVPVDVNKNLDFFFEISSRVTSFSYSFSFFSILKKYNFIPLFIEVIELLLFVEVINWL